MTITDDIAPDVHDITERMFIATADQNYILSRLAYFNQLDLDFFWLSLHAIEKYFKAMLLLNGRSAKGYGHNLTRLHSAAKKLHPDLVFGPLVDPEIQGLHWRNVSVEGFLARLNEHGHPSNRYLTYGYAVLLDDLLKVDQLIWSARRHCRRLTDRFDIDGREIEIDEVEQLRLCPERWTLSPLLPLEVLIASKHEVGLKRNLFLRLNTPFAPSADHRFSGWWMSASNPPLVNYFERLQAPQAASDDKASAANVLHWALQNIDFVKDDRKEIESALMSYAASVRAPPAN